MATYRQAFVVFCLSYLCLLAPYWLWGEQMRSACHATASGVASLTPAQYECDQAKLSDQETEFLPEIATQLQTPHESFVVVRNPWNEFGRPTKHITGNTPANIYTWLIYQFSDDPYVISFIMSVSLTWFAGLFVLLIGREWRLTPFAGCLGAIVMVTMPYIMYWATFPMHIATICWSTGLLYGGIRLIRHNTFTNWVIVTLSMYLLLMLGYPQAVVFALAIVGGYLVIESIKRQRTLIPFVIRMLSAGITALILVAPAYLDLYDIYQRSARASVASDFYLLHIQRIDSWLGTAVYTSANLVPQLFGNPGSRDFVFEYDGAGISPWYGLCVLITLVGRWRASWWWGIVIVIMIVLTISPSIYLTLVEAIPLLRISQWAPLWSAVLPIVVCVMLAVDTLSTIPPKRLAWIVSLWGIGVIAVVIGATSVAEALAVTLIPWQVGLIATMCIGMIGLIWLPAQRTWIIVGVTILTIAVYSMPLQRRQPADAVVTTSDLTTAITQHIPPQSRFANLSVELNHLMPPNFNTLHQIASIHTYHNFIGTPYQQALGQLGGKLVTYGRINGTIAPDIDGTMFWMSNIGMVMSHQPLTHPNLTAVATVGDTYLYTTETRMGSSWRMPVVDNNANDIRIDDYRSRPSIPIIAHIDHGDRIDITIAPRPYTTLIVISEQFSPAWQAQVFDGQTWQATRTVTVNGAFLGVLVPNNIRTVQLTYTTPVQWMWLSHLVWGLIVCGVLLMNRRRGQPFASSLRSITTRFSYTKES
jgi:hypothetical protein